MVSENDVELIVRRQFEKYESDVALPRHSENLNNFKVLFEALNRFYGIGIALGLLVGLPTAIAACISIYRAAHGMPR